MFDEPFVLTTTILFYSLLCWSACTLAWRVNAFIRNVPYVWSRPLLVIRLAYQLLQKSPTAFKMTNLEHPTPLRWPLFLVTLNLKADSLVNQSESGFRNASMYHTVVHQNMPLNARLILDSLVWKGPPENGHLFGCDIAESPSTKTCSRCEKVSAAVCLALCWHPGHGAWNEGQGLAHLYSSDSSSVSSDSGSVSEVLSLASAQGNQAIRKWSML